MSTQATLRSSALSVATALAVAAGGGVGAQETGSPGPLANMIIAGYGGTTYEAALGHAPVNTQNDFSASISPVLLFGMGEDFLFEAELEFGLSGELTTTTLEYAQIDYLGFEKVQFTVGKFLVPFGVFGERFHPTWINRFPTMPLLFGHAHGGVAEGSLMPILSDAGFMGRFTQPLTTGSVNLSLYVTQGPVLVTEEGTVDEGHAHSVVPAASVASRTVNSTAQAQQAAPLEIPDVGFGVAFADNNANKMIGGRLGYVRAPAVEVYVSGFHAMYDPDSYLGYQGYAVSLQTQRWGFQFLGEGALLRQEFQTETTFETLKRPGFYLEATRPIGSFEPVVRWSRLLDGKVGGVTAIPSIDELALGLNYRFTPTVPLKVAYLYHPDFDDRIVVQWAFGF